MSKALLVFLVFGSILNLSFSLLKEEPVKLNFDGLYVGKTGVVDIPGNAMEIFTYIRFYADGTVYTQSVTGYDPEAVSKWFGKDGKFERSGNYKVSKNKISFTVSNDNSPEKEFEGAKTDKYSGELMSDGKLDLTLTYASGKSKDAVFEYYKIE